jgi:hypothetical protein
VQPAEIPESPIVPRAPQDRFKALLNIPYALAVGSVGAGIASVFGLGWLVILGCGLFVGLIWGIFFDKTPPGVAKRDRLLLSLLLATLLVGLPFFILYGLAQYALADHLKPVVTQVLAGAYAFAWIRMLIGGLRQVREPKATPQARDLP